MGDCARLSLSTPSTAISRSSSGDSVTKEPIAGVSFRITKMNGEFVGRLQDRSRVASFSCELEPGCYSCWRPPPSPASFGQHPSEFEVKKGNAGTAGVENVPLSGLQIVKQDQDGKPLAGCSLGAKSWTARTGTFTVTRRVICYIPDLKRASIPSTEVRGTGHSQADTLPRNSWSETGKPEQGGLHQQRVPVFWSSARWIPRPCGLGNVASA